MAISRIEANHDVALDVGTNYTRIATREEGLLVEEPSVVAIDTRNGEVVAVGRSAQEAVSSFARHVVAYRPMVSGATVDFDVTARLIRSLVDRSGLRGFSRAKVIMGVPAHATSIERRALRQAAMQAGASDATLIESPIAAAVGLGLPVAEPVASAIITLGAGSSEASVISLGGIVSRRSIRLGGNTIDENIATIIRQRFDVVVSPSTAEWIKYELASATGRPPRDFLSVPARSIKDGEPVQIEVSAQLIAPVISDVVAQTVRMATEALGEAPPDLVHDVLLHGVAVVGGHANLRDSAAVFEHELGARIVTVEDTQRVVIDGLRLCLRETSGFRRFVRTAEA